MNSAHHVLLCGMGYIVTGIRALWSYGIVLLGSSDFLHDFPLHQSCKASLGKDGSCWKLCDELPQHHQFKESLGVLLLSQHHQQESLSCCAKMNGQPTSVSFRTQKVHQGPPDPLQHRLLHGLVLQLCM